MSLPATSITFGIRVIPPTSTNSSTLLISILPSRKQFSTGLIVRSINSSQSCSSLARVSFLTMCFGPLASAVINGKLISYSIALDNAIFAFSDSSLIRWSASACFFRSLPVSFLKSSIIQFITRSSKSSPPRCVSPFVANTSNTPSPMFNTEISNVPPPRSYTAMCSSFFLSSP